MNDIIDLDGVRATIADAKTRSTALLDPSKDPPPGAARKVRAGLGTEDLPPGQWAGHADRLGLPPECPVTPLGVDGSACYFLDTLGQLRELQPNDMGQAGLAQLFAGRINYLYWAWPRFSKQGAVESWKAEKVREALMSACARKGTWNTVERVRGRGAWRDENGDLVLHCGNRLWIFDREEATGEIRGHIYPARPAIPTPWPTSMRGAPSPARELLPLLRSWNWVRPEVDPILLLGFLGAAFLGGALDWRPAAFIIGDKSTGKSTLQGLVKGLLGDALIQSADTTAAGIYQRVGQDALAVAVDELEAESDPKKQMAVIKLARLSSSGALMLRGGSEHHGVGFQARSCFLFSSINAPPLAPQDLSRMAILRLNKLVPGSPPPDLPSKRMDRLGREILRCLTDNWHRLGPVLRLYREQLAAAGHDGRGQDTFGTLLACADLIVGDDGDLLGVPIGVEDLSPWQRLLKAADLPENEDAVENWRRCLTHLLTSAPDAWRNGGRSAVGAVLEEFRNNLVRGDQKTTDVVADTRKHLAQADLGLVSPKDFPGWWLAVPNQSLAVHKLFANTVWAGTPESGVWASALRQGPRGTHWELWKARVNGPSRSCTILRIEAVLGGGEATHAVENDPE